MELLELGRERDPSMNEPRRNPHQAHPVSGRPASWVTYAWGEKPPRPQKQKADILPTIGQYNHPWRTRLENVRKR